MTEPHEPDMVERVARAIADRRGSDIVQWFHKDDAKAAVAAMNAAFGADRMREALEKAIGFIETLADTDLDEQIADNGMTVGGKLQFDAPALVFNLRQVLGAPQ